MEQLRLAIQNCQIADVVQSGTLIIIDMWAAQKRF
jgi:hypothetical protein